MENNFGTFLKERRLEKKLTQKELAKILFVSESAVSKWEKNIAHPDITLLPKLSEILGVTEHELITASIDDKSREEKKQAKKWRAFSISWSLFFYIAYSITLIPCFICNLAISGTLSWFWIVASALLLSFTFTNLPSIIKRHKLLLLPLCMFLSLCVLLGTCCIYIGGNWFWIASLSVFLGLIIVFTPIIIDKYNIFAKINKYNDFISIGIDFIFLNILLVIIQTYTISNGFTLNHWYLDIALPIVFAVYFTLNILLCVRFIKINKLLKTSTILFLINVFTFIPPLLIKTKNEAIQKEINQLNIFKANFSSWMPDKTLNNNIFCIISLTLLGLSLTFFICGLLKQFKRKNK